MNSGFIPLVWIAAHWQALCGWGFALFLVYKVVVITAHAVKATTDVVDRATTAEQTILKIADNHIPHLQAELEKSNEHLAGLRGEISQVLKVIYPYESQ